MLIGRPLYINFTQQEGANPDIVRMDQQDIDDLIGFLTDSLARMEACERQGAVYIDQVSPHYQESARNLLHYLSLRTHDLRPLQERLASLGISSISHSERYTRTNVQNVLTLLHLVNGATMEEAKAGGLGLHLGFPRSKQRLQEHTAALFGPERHAGHTRIMVTLPSEAAEDDTLIHTLVEMGVEILRINCGHDDSTAWKKMIDRIQAARERCAHNVLSYMDLAGPKIRTGKVVPRWSSKGKRKDGFIPLQEGELIQVWKQLEWGEPAIYSDEGALVALARIGLSLPELFDQVSRGDRIWFDDGKIGGVIEEISPEWWTVRITMTAPDGAKLRSEKGINLPDSNLALPSLTEEDRRTLPFIAEHADMVGYSFVQRREDVEALQQALHYLGRPDLGIILKIETRLAFDNLPTLLLTAMKSPKVGVMIARGDLAVEVGWSRIAEVQEEIGWLCEAAHIPNIWATQVLENLAKTGLATRAEITDAVAAVRAECAMLNKGPYIVKAVKTLQKIDDRMDAHQYKKKPYLRPLRVAQDFLLSLPGPSDVN